MLNHKLKYLYLRNCDLEQIGAEYISQLILGNKTIIELDLFNCRLPQEGGNLIGNSLKQNFCIEKLSIGENKITRKDIETI